MKANTIESLEIKNKKFISVIVCFQASINDLFNFIKSIDAIFQKRFENYEFIIVNNQPDPLLSLQLKQKIGEEVKGNISIINLSWMHNIEDAMKAGIELSIGDLVFEFDSVYIDFKPDLILEVYKECVAGYDMVSAISKSSKKLRSRYFYKILRMFSNDLDLTSESFRMVSRRMINMASKTKEVFSYRKANYRFTGLKSKIIEYSPDGNLKKPKGSSLIHQFSLAGNILIYYSSIGTRISLLLSLLFFLMSILVGVYVIVSFLIFHNSIQEGWASIMLFLSLSFCGLFGILALISKYVEVLLKETKSIPPYTYRSIEKLDIQRKL